MVDTAADGTCDVVVVGAGLAGLRAADRLHAAGVDVVVLEARDRVGGRTLDGDLGGGEVVELGGAWAGPTQDRVLALADELGVGTFPTHGEGAHLVDVGGRVRPYSGTVPRMSPHVLADLEVLQRRVGRLVRQVDPADPLGAGGRGRRDRGRALDGRTLADLVRGPLHAEDTRAVLRAVTRSVWGAEPEDLGLLVAAAYAAAAGGLDALVDSAGGAQDRRFVGGSQRLARGLAERLDGRVRLGLAVRAVAQDADGVRVTAEGEAGGRTAVRARRVVVAVPPPLAARLTYTPALPADAALLRRRAVGGAIVKVVAVYDEPFWRADGLSGQAVSDREPAGVVFDVSSPAGRPGALLTFVGGRAATWWARTAPAEREAALLRALGRLFGDRARRPDRLLARDWTSDPWSGGGPVALPSPGTWTSADPAALRRPVGRVHWAGTEIATRWTGYLDGAVRSGERAAAEVLAAGSEA